MTKDIERFVRREYKKGASIRRVVVRVKERFGVGVTNDAVAKVLHKARIMRPPVMRNGEKRSITNNGYVLVFVGRGKHHRAGLSGYVMEHILVAEKTLGRELLPGEIVHHRDLNPSNNAPENLNVLQSDVEHRLVHAMLNHCMRVGKRDVIAAVGASRADSAFFDAIKPEALEFLHVNVVDKALPALRSLSIDATDSEIIEIFRSIGNEIVEDVA